jgi:multisubunit Na+/H+ antiporter MnhB subunit
MSALLFLPKPNEKERLESVDALGALSGGYSFMLVGGYFLPFFCRSASFLVVELDLPNNRAPKSLNVLDRR